MVVLSLLSQWIPRYMNGKPEDAKSQDENEDTILTPTASQLYLPFRLPITYVPTRQLCPLSTNLSSDLELMTTTTMATSTMSDVSSSSLATLESTHRGSMYEQLFQPTHSFGRQLIPEWGKQFSTDVEYLTDTQHILADMTTYQERIQEMSQENGKEVFQNRTESLVDESVCGRITTIWSGMHHPEFLEKYNYMEWTFLKPLNESSAFLQILSLGNILSPVVSLLIPVIFLLLPFVILKLQGQALTFEVYLDVLKRVAKNHFIGKAIMGIQSMTMDKLLYMVLMLGLYLMQIYQNVVTCRHFYDNTRQMNNDLLELRKFCTHSARSMDVFVDMHRNKASYGAFCEEVQRRSSDIKELCGMLAHISPFGLHVRKLGDLGDMLKCYYHVYSRPVAKEAIRYAIGFEGYVDNLRGVSRHVKAGHLSMATLGTSSSASSTLQFNDQYYPSLLSRADGENSKIVKNHVSLKKNIIITGPNASGKTTFLKTTAINIILTQQLGCGYYGSGSCLPRPYTHIHSYLNIPDTSERDSLFQAEARRCKEIIDAVGKDATESHHFSIFDELYSGTNPKEATKAAYAFLKYLSLRPNVDFILTTHYVAVCKKFKKNSKRVENYKMLVIKQDNVNHAEPSVPNCSKSKSSMKYTYRIKRGISKIEGAGQILEDMNYPTEIMGTFHTSSE